MSDYRQRDSLNWLSLFSISEKEENFGSDPKFSNGILSFQNQMRFHAISINRFASGHASSG